MSRVIILGATGSLGRHVLRQSVAAGHEVTVFRHHRAARTLSVHAVQFHTPSLRAPMRRP
jgi:uncharacterized protein YbjT (DUF2867 family)